MILLDVKYRGVSVKVDLVIDLVHATETHVIGDIGVEEDHPDTLGNLRVGGFIDFQVKILLPLVKYLLLRKFLLLLTGT